MWFCLGRTRCDVCGACDVCWGCVVLVFKGLSMGVQCGGVVFNVRVLGNVRWCSEIVFG